MSETPADPTEADNGQSRTRTVTVRVASAAAAFDELEERFTALDAGDDPGPLFEVVLQREEDLLRLLRSGTIELLRAIAREQPESIRETARLLDRDVHQVHDRVTELERLNLLRLEPEGQRKRSVVWYDDIEIELPIAGNNESVAHG